MCRRFAIDSPSRDCCNFGTTARRDNSLRQYALLTGWAAAVLLNLLMPSLPVLAASNKQQSLDEWRSLTSSNAPVPRVFVHGERVRFYFPSEGEIIAFQANWSRLRVPTSDYRVHSALLHWDQKLLTIPEHDRSWHEARVIAGTEWRQMAGRLIAQLTPVASGHGAYYQAFLADRLLYRDAEGRPRSKLLSEPHEDIVIDRRYSVDETLDLLARVADEDLARTHPGEPVFVLMSPNTWRLTQPLLVDRQRRRCVFLAPAALYRSGERGLNLSVTAQGLSALLPESHGWALLKNPVSSAARLADLGLQTVIRFLRLPLPKPHSQPPPVTDGPGMDLAAWEKWLDTYTGTRRQDGSMQLLIDGERFFPRFQRALAEATNNIHLNIYIFDRDDVGVAVADQLKQRSSEVDVKVIMDRMSSITAGIVPPATPLPEDFVPPASILSYLREDSRVQVRPFLNPWFSSDHSKVLLVDGQSAWVGGMNFGREYRYEWHDLMVELHGPVVTTFETEFRRHWAHEGPWGDLGYLGRVLQGPQPAIASTPGQWQQVRLLPTRTLWKPFESAVLGALGKARRYVYVENPYLFDKRVILALVKARNRGVDVRIILPRVNDLKVGGRSNLVLANYLLAHGLRIYFYPGMTHAKALLVDDWACLGSGNLNHISLRVNQEQNIASSDPRFAAQVKHDLFEQDFARSYEFNDPIAVDWVDFLADLVLEGL